MSPKVMFPRTRIRAIWKLVLVVLAVQIWMAGSEGARAQPDAETPRTETVTAPDSSEGLVTYEPRLTIDRDDDDLRTVVEGSSLLFALKSEPLDAIGALFERARTDEARIRRALHALGFFAATVAITIEGSRPDDEAAEDKLAATPPQRALNIAITIVCGPLFTIGKVVVEPDAGAAAEPLAALSLKVIGLTAGAPARSSVVLAADARIVAALREAGYPLVAIAKRDAVADHASATLDVTYHVNAGPKAAMGDVAVKGTDRMKAPFVAGLAPFAPGDPFSASALADYRQELDRLGVFDAISIEEAKAFDAQGRLPLTLLVNERPRHVVGVAASWSTLEGAALGAYWGHRNLFGEAEQLRFEAQASRLLSNGADDYEYALSSAVTLPAFPTRHDDLIVKLGAKRERPDAYARDAVALETRMKRRFDKFLSVEAGIAFTQAHETDALGTRDRTTISVPTAITYDTRNNPLEPISGLRASGEFLPLVNVAGGGSFAARFLGSISAYSALDDEARTVAAGRLTIGASLASDLADLPADVRFFSGGGGSVRGYPYQHLSPTNALAQIIGGRSLIESSVEVRHWLWEDIGVAAFVDAGGAFASNLPDLDDTGVGVGVGVRYRTPVGPVRLDVAVPLDPRGDDSSFAVYVALGQAF